MNPPSDPFYDKYVTAQLHAIAAGLGIPYELLTGDLSHVNYSSIRVGLQEFHTRIDADRWQVFIPTVCDRIWRWFIDAAFIAGKLPARDYSVEWNPPPFYLVDVEKDSKGERLQLEAGLKTWPQSVRERGRDPNKQLKEIAEWQKKAEKMGVKLNFSANAAPADSDSNDPKKGKPRKESKDADE